MAHEKPVTTTISLDAVTYKKLKYLAIERRMTVRALIREAVSNLLQKKGRS